MSGSFCHHGTAPSNNVWSMSLSLFKHEQNGSHCTPVANFLIIFRVMAVVAYQGWFWRVCLSFIKVVQIAQTAHFWHRFIDLRKQIFSLTQKQMFPRYLVLSTCTFSSPGFSHSVPYSVQQICSEHKVSQSKERKWTGKLNVSVRMSGNLKFGW